MYQSLFSNFPSTYCPFCIQYSYYFKEVLDQPYANSFTNCRPRLTSIFQTGENTTDEAMSQGKQGQDERNKSTNPNGGKHAEKSKQIDTRGNETTQFAKIRRRKDTVEASKSYIPRPSTRHPRIRAARAPASYEEIGMMNEKAYPSSLKKHKPKKQPGDKVIAEGVDRTMAMVGEVDETMMIITFEVERKDKNGQVVRGQHVTYGYLENHVAPDWNSAEDIRGLNHWRRQIYGRNLPSIRKPRELWLQSEKDLVLDIVRDHFETRHYVKWNALANVFNRKMAMAKVVQRAGETFVSSGLRKADALTEDRVAPWRSKQAIMGQCTSRWPEYRELLHKHQLAANDEDDVDENDDVQNNIDESPDSGDEDEIPDPNPLPRPEITHQRIKKPTATGAKTLTIHSKKRAYNDIEQNGDTGTEESGKETEEEMMAKKLKTGLESKK